MDLKLNDISDIATTIGVVISTLTLYSAYRLYKIGKRDSYIKSVRNTLISFHYNSGNLNKLLTFEITHELVNTVVYSTQIDRLVSHIYANFFLTNKTKDELENYLDEINPITVSIHTELLDQFDKILKANSEESSKVFTDFPSLYRVYEAVILIFEQTIEISKHMVRDERIIKDIFIDMFDQKDSFQNTEDVKEFIFYQLMLIIQTKHSESDQKDINDALSILGLTTNGLLRLSDKDLFKQMKQEQRIKYKVFDSTENIFQDLLESEKGLRFVLTEEELLNFREFSTKIKARKED